MYCNTSSIPHFVRDLFLWYVYICIWSIFPVFPFWSLILNTNSVLICSPNCLAGWSTIVSQPAHYSVLLGGINIHSPVPPPVQYYVDVYLLWLFELRLSWVHFSIFTPVKARIPLLEPSTFKTILKTTFPIDHPVYIFSVLFHYLTCLISYPNKSLLLKSSVLTFYYFKV